MAVKTFIKDGSGRGFEAKVTSRGQLVVAPLEFSDPYAVTADVVNTAYNFVSPVTNKRFVITGILLDAGKTVSASTAGNIVIYEAAGATDTTSTKDILSVEMLKNTNRVITGLNLISSEGIWLNIKTTDAAVTATLLGYYIDS